MLTFVFAMYFQESHMLSNCRMESILGNLARKSYSCLYDTNRIRCIWSELKKFLQSSQEVSNNFYQEMGWHRICKVDRMLSLLLS